MDPGVLLKCLEKHVDLLEDMGAYEILSSGSACSWKPLVHLKPVWAGLLRIEGSAMFSPACLRQALGGLLVSAPHLNSLNTRKTCSGGMWTSLKVERLNVLMAHARKS